MSKKKIGLKDKIINIIFDILIAIFGITLLISIYNNIQVKILGNSYASFFGYSTFEVQTGSMADKINIGDWIIVKKTSKIMVNDVVTYEKKGDFITHRVVEVYNGMYVTKGDANNTKDEAITKNEIVGKVVKILPNFGIIRKIFFNPWVLITLIVTIYLFSSIFRKNKKEAIIKKVMDKSKEKKVIEKAQKEEKEMIEIAQNVVLEPVDEEELDKTAYFRMVSVDKSEIEDTYMKIANTELENTKTPKKIKEEKRTEEIDDESEKEDEYLVKSSLEMLKKKNKRFNNIFEKIIYIKSEEINEVIDILQNKRKLEVNESTIKGSYLKNYLNVRYYNYANFNKAESAKKIITKLEEVMIKTKDALISRYKGSDTKYSEKVLYYLNIFMVIIYLEEAYKISDSTSRKKAYKVKINKYLKEQFVSEIILKDVISKIIKTQRVFSKINTDTLKKLDSNTFELEINDFESKNNLCGVNLIHNIAFSKVYSDYIIDKTYSEGIVAEDKIIVLMNLLFVQMIKESMAADFGHEYLLYIPSSIYSKQNKLEKIFSILNNDYLKTSIIILLRGDDLIHNKVVIKKLVKEGYRFAVNYDSNIVANDTALLYIVDYIFMSKECSQENKYLEQIPNDIQNKLILEEVISKVGDLGDSKA